VEGEALADAELVEELDMLDVLDDEEEDKIEFEAEAEVDVEDAAVVVVAEEDTASVTLG
jgi:hypothetical protein